MFLGLYESLLEHFKDDYMMLITLLQGYFRPNHENSDENKGDKRANPRPRSLA